MDPAASVLRLTTLMYFLTRFCCLSLLPAHNIDLNHIFWLTDCPMDALEILTQERGKVRSVPQSAFVTLMTFFKDRLFTPSLLPCEIASSASFISLSSNLFQALRGADSDQMLKVFYII